MPLHVADVEKAVCAQNGNVRSENSLVLMMMAAPGRVNPSQFAGFWSAQATPTGRVEKQVEPRTYARTCMCKVHTHAHKLQSSMCANQHVCRQCKKGVWHGMLDLGVPQIFSNFYCLSWRYQVRKLLITGKSTRQQALIRAPC
jgi:hypothetical protein